MDKGYEAQCRLGLKANTKCTTFSMVFVLRENNMHFVIVSLQFTFTHQIKHVSCTNTSFSQISVIHGGELQ